MLFMHNFLSFIKEFKIPKKETLEEAVSTFSKTQFMVFTMSLIVAIFVMILMLDKINKRFMVEVASDGGTITEGIIGMPSLINPVLATSDADKDLTAIIYSGLMRKDSNGMFIPDLANSFEVSDDGLIYTFHLNKKAKFHDGVNVSADDIIFTIDKIQDPLIKSPKKSAWNGIIAEKKDDSTVIFKLNKPYISFMNNMTIGILPKHLWSKVSPPEFNLSILNIKAIGSGPYKIDSIVKNNDGLPKTYKLKRYNDFVLGKPHMEYINIISYANEKDLIDALSNHSIDQAGGISPENAKFLKDKNYLISTSTLPRIFGIFFNNERNPIFKDRNVIKAIDLAIDRQAIIDGVLYGYGDAIHNPIPDNIFKNNSSYTNTAKVAEANALLDKSQWIMGANGIRNKGSTTTIIIKKKVGKKTIAEKVTIPGKEKPVTLSFSLITGDTPELKHASILIKEQLAKIGIEVDIKKIYESGALNQQIRARDYEALFFGQVLNTESDLFAFWHSSQINDPGLNIAMYNSKKADDILSAVQKMPSYNDRVIKYKELVKEFDNNIPAVLIYSPKYLYATYKNFSYVIINTITNPSERFETVYTWYASKERVWKIFTKNKQLINK